jgi:hypothetical protein
MVSRPGKEVGMTYSNQYMLLSISGHLTYRLGSNTERLSALPEHKALDGHPFWLRYLAPNALSQKMGEDIVRVAQVKASA